MYKTVADVFEYMTMGNLGDSGSNTVRSLESILPEMWVFDKSVERNEIQDQIEKYKLIEQRDNRLVLTDFGKEVKQMISK